MISLSSFSELPFGLLAIYVTVFGLLVGSFLNVVVARLPAGESLVNPRSRCPGCKKPIAWYDNLPVLSWIFLRGRCRGCKTSISIRYPVIEMLTALLFLASWLLARQNADVTWVLFVRDWPLLAMLVAITFIDLEHRIIPNELSFGGLVLGLATGWAVPDLGWQLSIGGAVLGFGFFWALAAGYEKITGRMGLGGGDIKLLAMLGAFFGPIGVFTTILISSVIGSLVGITWGLIQNRTGSGESSPLMRVSIPFGPFLVLGALYYYLLGELLWLPFTRPI